MDHIIDIYLFSFSLYTQFYNPARYSKSFLLSIIFYISKKQYFTTNALRNCFFLYCTDAYLCRRTTTSSSSSKFTTSPAANALTTHRRSTTMGDSFSSNNNGTDNAISPSSAHSAHRKSMPPLYSSTLECMDLIIWLHETNHIFSTFWVSNCTPCFD